MSKINYKQTATAKKGRNGDTVTAHLQEGEMIVPPVISPELRSRLLAEMQAAGIPIEEYTVGEGMSINPETGLPEFGFGKVFKKIASPIAKVIGAVPGGSILAPIALTAAGMPYLAAGVSGANTLGNGGSLLQALGSAGATYGAGYLADGGASSLGSALGLSDATAGALGGAGLGAIGGGLGGGGLGGILSGALAGGAGGYLGNGGASQLGLTGAGGITDTLGLGSNETSSTLFSNGASTGGEALGGNTASTVGGGSWLDDLSDFAKNPFASSADSVPAADVGKAFTVSSNGGTYFDGLKSPYNTDFSTAAAPAATTLASGSSNMASPSIFQRLLTNGISTGLGTNANNNATEELLKAQQQQMATLQPFATAKYTPADLANDPGYQFQLAEGTKAIDAANAARGNYYSGAALKDATQYATNLADTTNQGAFQRWLQQQGLNLSGANGIANIQGSIGQTNAQSGIQNSNLLSRGLSGILGGGGFSNTGQGYDQDALLRLLRGVSA